MPLLRARGWCAIGFLESMPDGWIDYLEDTHIPIGLIIHEHDVYTEKDEKKNPDNKAGTLKKPHAHINFYFDGKKSIQQVREILEPIGVKLLQPMHSSQGATRYLLHMDNPEKYQYDESEIVALNGVCLDFSKVVPQSRINEIMNEMAVFLRTHEEVDDFATFWFWCQANEPDWFDVLNNSKSYVISKVLFSRTQKKKEKEELRKKGQVQDD